MLVGAVEPSHFFQQVWATARLSRVYGHWGVLNPRLILRLAGWVLLLYPCHCWGCGLQDQRFVSAALCQVHLCSEQKLSQGECSRTSSCSIGQSIGLIAEASPFCGVCFRVRVLGISLVPHLICVSTDAVAAASHKQ